MRTLYEAASGVEAHMLLDLLKQRGIEAHIQGEHLQGAMGELPAAGLVRLVIDEERYDEARDILDAWEALQPASPPPVRRRGSGLRWFALGLLLGAGGLYGLVRTPVSADGIDHDRDGRNDETWTYSPRGTVLKVEADRNRDGRIDYIVHHDERGIAASGEFDDDFDGRFESRMRYHQGNADFSQVDSDGDGFLDLLSYFDHGVMARSEYLDPVTGKVLRAERFRLGKLVSAEIDTDRDGQLDTLVEYTGLGEVSSRRPIPEQPPRQP